VACAKSQRRIYPVEHILVSTRGLRWQDIQMAMFTVYFDDSGTSPSQHVAIATAMIIPARQIIRLEREWETLKRKEGFSCFHTAEFMANNSKSEFANWDEEKRQRVFKRVRDITKKYATRVFSFAVYKEDYDQIVPEDVREVSGKHHYSWAIRHVVTHLDLWKTASKIEPPLEYVFDLVGNKRTDKPRVEVENVMEQAEEVANEKGRFGEFTNYSFRSRKTLAGLQCADVLAWTCYQYALYTFRDTPLSEFAVIAWNDFLFHEGLNNWSLVTTIKRENLAKWVANEIADGRWRPRLEAWKKKAAAKRIGGKRIGGKR
jgi:Protein of unknown function (DUF3800)